MLWVLGPIQPPPPVSVARIVGGIGLTLLGVAIVFRGGKQPVAVSNGLAALCLWLAMYPTGYTLGKNLAANHESAFSAMYCLVGVMVAVVVGQFRSEQQGLQKGLSVIAGVTTTLFLVLLLRTYVFPESLSHPVERAITAISAPMQVKSPNRTPDIIHVVLDGLGRLDVLERDFGLDLEALVSRLEQLEFAVDRRRVYANYTQTQLTFASMLNMRYLDDLTSAAGRSNDRRPLLRLVEEAAVPKALRRLGYDLHLLGSGYHSSGVFKGSQCDCPQLWFADAEFGALSLTPFRTMIGGVGERAHFNRALAVFEGVARFEPAQSPAYMFAHVPMPHPPFLVDETGAFMPTQSPASGRDGSNFAGTADDYRRGYARQARFALTRAIASAEVSIGRARRRGRELVFIISGDHGPRLGFDVHRPQVSSAGMVLPVFMAIRYAGVSEDGLPTSLVNLYSSVFRNALGVPIADRPNRALLSGFSTPYTGEHIRLDELSAYPIDAAR
jgi:hypothetical protein